MAIDISVVASKGESHTAANLAGLSKSAFEAKAVKKQAPTAQSEIVSGVEREMGDQVNRFLLCTLVSESSKRIKASAEKAGETLPMAMIVRGVLRSYRLALKDKHGPLSEGELDIAGLRRLNEQVLKDEIARHTRDRVKTSERQQSYALRPGDDTRIKAVKEDIERAIASRDRRGKEVL